MLVTVSSDVVKHCCSDDSTIASSLYSTLSAFTQSVHAEASISTQPKLAP